ncbi:MAG: cobalamin-dependent protein [Spirochaetes bacterium]|nr:cobalamin-dependent protein [Spirochaetota bacterium]
MRDRKLRTIGVLSFFTGSVFVVISLVFFYLNLSSKVTIPILILFAVIQFRLAPRIYNKIYNSKIVDFPGWLQNRFPPKEYDPGFASSDIILLRTPSMVLSGPDCGESLGLGYLASVLRAEGYRVNILDSRLERLDVMQTVELLLAYNPKALGVNLNFQYLAASTAELLSALRSRDFPAHITLGGLYASVAYEEIMEQIPAVDTIVRFEGEHTYSELVKFINNPQKWPEIQGLVYRDTDGGVIVNPLRPLIKDIDSIPDPARDALPLAARMGGYAYIVSSRGCNGICAYCVQQRSVTDPKGRRWRGRNPTEIADEIQQINENYGLRRFSFVDDDIFGASINGKTHAHRVAEELVERKLDVSILISIQPRDVNSEAFSLLRKAGVDSAILAVDNFSQPVLDRYRKQTTVDQNLRSIEILKDLDMDAYLGIIMFDPWTSLDELDDNMEIMTDIPFLRPWQVLSKLEIYRGSPLTEELDKQGLLEWNGYTASYKFIDNRIQSVYMAIENIMKTLHSSMSELDGFRWGNLGYLESDLWILDHFKENLNEISAEYNRQAIEISRQVVKRQQVTTEAINPDELADQELTRQAELLNRQTLWQIKELRNEAMDDKKNHEVERIPVL